VELQRSVYLSIGLLEGIAYAEDAWIDLFLGYDGFNVQFITVISNGLLLFHGIKGCVAAALDEYATKNTLAGNSKALRGTRLNAIPTLAFTLSEFQVLGVFVLAMCDADSYKGGYD